MKQKFLRNIPTEIVIDILSRLPVRSVIRCKCVHKSWLHLVETQEFVSSHLSKSVPWLLIAEFVYEDSISYSFFEFEDEHPDLLHCKLVTKSNLSDLGCIMGSADGLLLLCKFHGPDTPSICNPTTREYVNLPCRRQFTDGDFGIFGTWGFGSSKISSQCKVVGIFEKRMCQQYNSEVVCYVYTLGTGLWRRHASCPLLMYSYARNGGVFANGNIHWLVRDLDCCLMVSCFDLETENFSIFPTPPPLLHWIGESFSYRLNFFAWEGCLCLCDNTSANEIVIWLMKEYGVEKSWTKQFVISNVIDIDDIISVPAYPIKIFKDGDILFQLHKSFIYYSNKTKTTQKVDMFEQPRDNDHDVNIILNTSSFLSLDVSSF